MTAPPMSPGLAAPSSPPRPVGANAADTWSSRPAPQSAAAALATPVIPGTQALPETPARGEQAPQAARHRPPPVRKTAPSRRLQPGDLVCGACGEGNPPVRKFCSRCGESLVEAEVVKRPWWNKLMPAPRGPKVVQTADGKGHKGNLAVQGFDFRHFLRKGFRRLRLVVGVLILLGGVAYGAIPSVRSAVDSRFNNTKGKVLTLVHPNYVPVHAVKVATNMSVAGHPGRLAVDEFTNTYWLAPWNGTKQPTLTLTFGHKVTLKEMIFYSGVDANYLAYGRPSVLHLVFSNGASDTIAPDDTEKPQTLPIKGANGITSVEVQILSVYQGNKGSNVAITEIELFALQL
jgi:hypothetical protein